MVVRIASYNTALSRSHQGALLTAIKSGRDKQVLATVALLQHIRPDIILLNEVDFDPSGQVVALLQQALRQPSSYPAIDYPYAYCQAVNTGMPSGRDFDKDGIASNQANDALGYGLFPGQYGMLLLSRFPIDTCASRTFKSFLWQDMPAPCLPKDAQGKPWFDVEDMAVLPLSSKSHWDVAVNVEGRVLRCLCSHPTPPVFDGEERRNACRNHDEIRFWTDYLSSESYFYDDQGRYGGLEQEDFVLLGDLNASPVEGDSYRQAIVNLLHHPKMSQCAFPESLGAAEHTTAINKSITKHHTAVWRMQADYVRPSQTLSPSNQAVFWPSKRSRAAQLLEHTSDHRLVYLDLHL
ncbi:endonuclease/exonuclease/phosphatase family protein [Marinomonas pollencensis]|uniref:Endonuclease/exonuclease/phosphatase family protein n=1 Tax=Marinomonas pollencensis TaxID=491954 RepID=A0A3E0DIS4_9GAMM|nr:endonuclease/exonuclease/phosphatase family protein [Marinomonas pollencensis]REG81338.1 endonuclease/exonuclease/phosphatase family protein [Marinomonas pollencensis]